jgi:hypothetical protein
MAGAGGAQAQPGLKGARVTERKPLGMPFETWADRQIREAEERG